jgi:hypothetical protein
VDEQLHDEPFDEVGTLTADPTNMETFGTPAWLVVVRFGSDEVDVLAFAAAARGLTALAAGQRVRVKGSKHSVQEDRTDERRAQSDWVILADSVEPVS